MRKTLRLFLSFLFLYHTAAFAQNTTVTGRVTTTANEPLSGVTIKVSGSSQGASSDPNGNFSIAAPPASTLLFSYVGFISQSIELKGRTIINVVMQNSGDSLNTVIVTALGIRKDVRKLGYATATVNNDQLATNRTPNVMSGLQGKMAGVNITTMGTGPAGSVKVRIRGQSSFNAVNAPLIVLNGVPMDNSSYGIGVSGPRAGQVNSTDGGDGFASINPDDVESMTVLKGAAASALYGYRAKDGVIMVTTKSKSARNGVGVDYNINYTTDTPLDYTDFQYEYGQGERGVRPTTPFPQSGVWSFGEKFQPGMTQVLFDGKTFPYEPVYDRYKKFYRTGTNLTNTVTLSTAGDKGGLSLSLSNTENKGILPNSKFTRRTVNLGFTQNVTKQLTLFGNVNYSNEENINPPQVNTQDMAVPTVLYTLANSMPFYALEQNQVLPNGNEFVMSRFLVRNNPYYSVNYRKENIRRDRVLGNIAVKYQFTPWLYAQGRIAQDIYTRYQDYNIPNGYAPIPAAPSGFVNGSFTQDIRRFRERNYDFLLGANQQFGNFGVDITAGGNQLYRKMEYNSVLATDFIIPGLYTIQNGRVKDPIYSKTEQKVNSLYGALELSYRNFLYLNATARNDWFSTLAPAHNNILYPSVSASFVFSEAMHEHMPTWLDFGKVRLAYAEVGSDGSVAPYSNVLYYAVNNNLYPNPAGATVPIGGINGTQVPNPALQPSRTSETEAGIELKMFGNRLNLDLSYYYKTTKDQILGILISDASSYTSKLINVGKSMNRGFEMMLNVVPVQLKSFQWDVTLNASYNTSNVIQLGPNAADTSINVSNGGGRILRQVVGKPIGALYTYMYLRDKTGQQVFDKASGKPMRNEVPQYVGNVLPKYFGGITNQFNYNGITLSVLVDFKLGAKMIAGSNQNALRHGLQKRTLVGRAQGYVVGVGVNPDGGTNTTRSDLQPFYETPNVLGVNEDWVFNSGFWKLRQITLGYDFTKWVRSVKFIKGVKLSAVANNVAILKKWTENMDPENTANISDNETGLDFWTAVPPTRSLGFNLGIKF
ncbi:MAG: SusC/RagA family TonB-linked outer membrane protein [Williamsia sp.]|nr:SusC/RagA family TonB-linked outer membrane protein [Williamsia sp.]